MSSSTDETLASFLRSISYKGDHRIVYEEAKELGKHSEELHDASCRFKESYSAFSANLSAVEKEKTQIYEFYEKENERAMRNIQKLSSENEEIHRSQKKAIEEKKAETQQVEELLMLLIEKVERIKSETEETKKRIEAVKSELKTYVVNSKNELYEDISGIKWIEWNQDADSPLVTITAKFVTDDEEDSFTFAITNTVDVATRSVVENIDWIWEEIYHNIAYGDRRKV